MNQVSSKTSDIIRELIGKLTEHTQKLELKFEIGDINPQTTIFILDEIKSCSYDLSMALDAAIELNTPRSLIEKVKWVFSTCAAAIDYYSEEKTSLYFHTMINEVKPRIDQYLKEIDKLG